MFQRIAPIASVALLAFSLWAEPCLAAPGDTVIPAHRTRSGAYVPASVPPMSAGNRLAAAPGKSSKTPAQGQFTTTFAVPLLADAQPIRR
jgi:hypothetical protein